MLKEGNAEAEQHNIYLQRINTVIDHVHENLHEALSVEELAGVAGFSPFHFHRIFKGITGETVLGLVTRARLGRAAMLLRSDPELSVSDAAFASGFKSLAVFSRGFKRQFEMRVSDWDRKSPLKDSKNRQFPEYPERYTVETLERFEARKEFPVKIEQLPPLRLAYIRVLDSYRDFERIKDAYRRLVGWYSGRGGDLAQTRLIGMSQDDPDFTPQELCRFDWCLAVPDDWDGEGEIAIRSLPELQLATVRCQGGFDLEMDILQYLYLHWFPNSDFQPDNYPGMEIYNEMPDAFGWEHFDLNCSIPISALS